MISWTISFFIVLIIYRYITEHLSLLLFFFTGFEFQFMKSKKGNWLINSGNYKYFAHYKRKDRVSWRCSTHHKKGCRATLISINGQIVSTGSYLHNHWQEIFGVIYTGEDMVNIWPVQFWRFWRISFNL